MKRIGEWFDRLFNKHKLVRRLLVFWAASLITWVIFRVFSDLTLINSSVVGALSIVVGLLATVIAFYKWMRSKDEHVDDGPSGS